MLEEQLEDSCPNTNRDTIMRKSVEVNEKRK